MTEIRLADILKSTRKQLADAGIDKIGLDSQFLIEHVLDLDRTQLFIQHDRILTSEEVKKIQSLIDRRLKQEPVARIIGERHFWGLPFQLNEATLEPRPDSETLIEVTLKSLDRSKHLRILDLGTGTGCLLLALLSELPNATGLGLDIAPKAIQQGQINAKHLELETRTTFKTNNWLEGIDEKFDVIVSNPPYIKHDDIASLMPDVCNHDPLLALDGGEDGLQPYRLLIPRLQKYLNPKGLAVFEIGEGQAKTVADLFQQNGFSKIATHKDLGGIDRCVTAQGP